jgi:hypothetical protein
MTEEEFTDVARTYPEAFHKVVALMQTVGGEAVINAIVKRGGFYKDDPAFPRGFKRKPGWKYRIYNLGPIIAKPIAGFVGATPVDLPDDVKRKAVAEGRMGRSFLQEPREIPAQILVGEGDYTDALTALKKSVKWVGSWLQDRAPASV